ncbi:MAG: hypothetical protein LBB36_03110, partial [Fibromonadaceae bacterium]|nr:hypothetical protein [Fibromonadaceae bacterium]
MRKHFLWLFLLSYSVFALEAQSDTKDAFIFADDVKALSEQPCKNDVLFMPENSSFFGDAETPGVPFRTYTIALPNSFLPSVSLENIKSEKLNGKPCETKQVRSLQIGKPYLKDNLWQVKIGVPLVYSSGNSWYLRKSFRVRVNFSGNPGGYAIGKRVLSQVENKNAAARFGASRIQASNTSMALKKNVPDNMSWLARIGIGSKELSITEDGMYAVSFDDLRRVAGSGMDGIRISDLRLFSASPDTLPEMVGYKTFPNAEEIPIIVKDKNNDGIFNSGDSIIFFGYGTAIWKKSGSASGMDYYFSHSPYSFYQYFYLGAGGTGKRLESKKNSNANGQNVSWKKYARSEKYLILRDNYYSSKNFDSGCPDAIEENTGKEWFWAWGNRITPCNPNPNAVSINTSEFQNSVRNLNRLQGDSIWIGVSFFPRRSLDENRSLSSRPWKQRMEGINFNFFFQDKRLQNIKDTILGGSFVFASDGAKAANNSYKVEISAGTQNDRFNGLSVAY